MQFICEFHCFFAPSKSNTSTNFFFVDASNPKLCPSLFFFITKAWLSLIKHYLGTLRLSIVILIQHIALLRYKESEAYILSPNLLLILLDLRKIDDKLSNNLVARRISQILSSPLFLCSPLKLVPNDNSRF